MTSTDADVLIIGGGIAGASAAWFATRAGRHVTLVDEAVHRASDLPIALVNPLRGRTGRLVADGIDGMHATFAMIATLRAAGHRVDGGRGLYRPLVGVDAAARHEAFWAARLTHRLAYEWCGEAPGSLGLVDRVPTLRLVDAGWVAPPTLLAALLADCAPTRLADRAVVWSTDGAVHRVGLASGDALVARTALWCGGAWGASLLDGAVPDGLYKPGTLLAVDAPLVGDALSFGLYATPWLDAEGSRATLVGPTREGSQSRFTTLPVATSVVAALAGRIERTFGPTPTPRPVWRGMRLTRLSSSASQALSGIATITELDSRGFLLAPLRAAAWARSLA